MKQTSLALKINWTHSKDRIEKSTDIEPPRNAIEQISVALNHATSNEPKLKTELNRQLTLNLHVKFPLGPSGALRHWNRTSWPSSITPSSGKTKCRTGLVAWIEPRKSERANSLGIIVSWLHIQFWLKLECITLTLCSISGMHSTHRFAFSCFFVANVSSIVIQMHFIFNAGFNFFVQTFWFFL